MTRLIGLGLANRLAQLEPDQIVSGHVQCEGLGTADQHRAQMGLNGPTVGDVRRDKGCQTRILDREGALIDDLGIGLALGIKAIAAVHEVLVGDVRRRDEEARHIDLGLLAEDHAIGVDEEQLAIGLKPPKDRGGLRAGHAVQGDGAGRRLNKLSRAILGHAKGSPVDDHLLGGLIDGQR